MRKFRTGAILAVAVVGVVAVGTVVTLRAQKRSAAVVVDEPRVTVTGPLLAVAGPQGQVATVFAGGPQIGVQVRDVADDEVAKLKLPSAAAVVVESVTPGTPAEKAGVKAGDAIVEFDGERIRSVAQLTRLVRESAEGRAVKLAVWRDGRRLELSVTPAAGGGAFSWSGRTPEFEGRLKEFADRFEGEVLPRLERELPRLDRQYRFEMLPDGRFHVLPRGDLGGRFSLLPNLGRGRLGIGVEDLEGQLAEYFGAKDGVLVRSVDDGSAAAKAGIKAGDVITSIDGEAVKDVEALLSRLDKLEDGAEVSVGLLRDRKPLTLKATIEPREPARRRLPGRGVRPIV